MKTTLKTATSILITIFALAGILTAGSSLFQVFAQLTQVDQTAPPLDLNLDEELSGITESNLNDKLSEIISLDPILDEIISGITGGGGTQDGANVQQQDSNQERTNRNVDRQGNVQRQSEQIVTDGSGGGGSRGDG